MNYLSDKDFDLLPFQLGLLRNATNYQKWTLESVYSELGDRILEIGSGIGNMSRWLPVRERLILSEIDPALFSYLQKTVEQYFKMDKRVEVLKFNLDKGWEKPLETEDVDTIVSFNVMEHVEDDELFFSELVSILKKSKSKKTKKLITFVPAHNFAYGATDKYYGHYRRYSCASLRKIKEVVVPEAKFFCRYFNLIGLPGWIIWGKIFRNKQITRKSVLCFEKLCPLIKTFDDFLHVKLRVPFGQSVLCVITL